MIFLDQLVTKHTTAPAGLQAEAGRDARGPVTPLPPQQFANPPRT